MNWSSGKIIEEYFKEWELLKNNKETLIYENPETNQMTKVVNYTGSNLNPRRFKNRVTITNKEIALGLVKLLIDKTSFEVIR